MSSRFVITTTLVMTAFTRAAIVSSFNVATTLNNYFDNLLGTVFTTTRTGANFLDGISDF